MNGNDAFQSRLSAVPACVQEAVRRLWGGASADLRATDIETTTSLIRLWACSDFAAQICARDPALVHELLASGDLRRCYAAGELRERLRPANEAETEADLKAWLRRARRREWLRLAWRDLAGWADLDEVMHVLSEFADVAIDAALAWLHQRLMGEWGEPRGESGAQQRLVVLGLGKLGGNELNFSSDVDLIFVYPEEGETTGGKRGGISNHEFFTRLGRALIAVLHEATEDGFVFRVDMRLRPNGNSGPLALSFDATEYYYQTHGREWERYALIKARPIAGDLAAGEELLASLKPFVFRRYLDYGAIDAIRELKTMIDSEVARKGLEDNIKLGAGGIREIEFIGQALQLIRGGRDSALQERSIQKVLGLARERGFLTAQAVSELMEAYTFLRRLEHRLQMLADRQTHNLPHDDCERARIAYAMDCANWLECETRLRRHRKRVHEHFEQVFTAPQGEAPTEDKRLLGLWLNALDDETSARVLMETGFADPEGVRALLQGLREGPAYAAFSAQGRARMDRLMPLLLAAAGLTVAPQVTLERLVRLLEAIGRRTTYLVLLIENPMALSQLVKLCAASSWIADWLSQHPVLLDELIDPVALYNPLSHEQLVREAEGRLRSLPPDDLGARMDALREFRHGHLLRVAAADIGVGLPTGQVSLHLCDIAEVVLGQGLALAEYELARKHGRPRRAQPEAEERLGFAVIGYGKLGSRELGYASDLDLIFLFDPAAEGGMTDGAKSIANEVYFARLGQRLIHILTARTPAGVLYNVDMRLRPSGQSGMLVTHLDAFRTYQLTHAWTWEHQALVRARAVAGDADVGARFTELRQEILCRPRDPARLRAEVREMRERMRTAQGTHDAGWFDLKHDPGGIVDIEFMVQYAVLRWAADYPALTRHTDNMRILGALAEAGLVGSEQAHTLADAYRRYLSLEQRLKLMEHRPWLERAEVGDGPSKVVEIWRAFFDEEN